MNATTDVLDMTGYTGMLEIMSPVPFECGTFPVEIIRSNADGTYRARRTDVADDPPEYEGVKFHSNRKPGNFMCGALAE
jgi:hypothetical protein